MWTYNVARDLTRRAGYTPWPIRIPPDPITVFRQAAKYGVAASDVICVKVHSRFEGDFPGLKILCNLRDARDALVSWMRFTHSDFESALDGFEESLALTDYYLGNSSLDVMLVRYEDLMQRPAETILRISVFIGFPVDREQADLIAAAYSRDEVRRRITRIEDSSPTDGSADSVEIRNVDGTARNYDVATGFQSGHVSDSRGGEWRELLNESQQQRLAEITDRWLARNGYDV